MAEIKAEISQLVVTPSGPIVVLKESDGNRSVVIGLSSSDFTFLYMAYGHKNIPASTPHETIRSILAAFDMTIDKVIIDVTEDGTGVAQVYISSGDKTVKVEARPSDAIAIALKMNSPIFIEESAFSKVEKQSEKETTNAQITWLANVDFESMTKH